MAEQQHHHHHQHHKKDSATIFKEKSLRAIKLHRKIGKWIKMTMLVVAIIMGLLVVAAYTIG